MPIDEGAARATTGSTDAMALPNTLTPRERNEGWKLLFDGTTLTGWQRYDGAPITAGWKAVDGALTRAERGGSDIVTVQKYRNYELALEWKLSPDGPPGNSGVFYNVIDTGGIYWGAPEMQILDDARHGDGRSALTSTGSNYALHGVPHGTAKPIGEWNAVRIVVRGNHVEHWLNGAKVVDYDFSSADWKARMMASKFKDRPLYATAREGRIGLQEHGSFVAFRNIRIKETK
ncbi:MAG: DUF1080 domain-containing protein [Gemmatimonas sp.]